MWSRMAVLAITLGACSFRHGTVPGDGSDQPPNDVLRIDASTCAAVDVQAGGEHTCAITVDGSLYCWGRGNDGQIGIDPLAYACVGGNVYCQRTPVKIAIPPVLAVGLGAAHTCASTATEGYCWGKNTNGQYGNGSMMTATKPTLIGERAGATMLDGGFGHTCSLAAGAVSCSGLNNEGQVGNMSVAQQPTAVTVATNMMEIDVGSSTSCAIDPGKQLYCWGRNAFRTIDPNTTTIKTSPTLVPGISLVDQVAVGADHICALATGQLRCWGLNTSGQIGNGQINSMSQPQPITLVALGSVVEVAAHRNHTCARTSNGDVYCFGEGYTATPTVVATVATKITAGSGHDCAIFVDGTVRCWGDQLYGQLGNGLDSATRATQPQLAPLCP